MRPKTRIGVLPILVAIALGVILLQVRADPNNEYVIDGDSVYIDDDNVYINITPHTIANSQDILFRVTSKSYTGDVDVVWGFNTSEVKPVAGYYYSPHVVNSATDMSMVLVNAVDNGVSDAECEIGFEYNEFKRNITYENEFGTVTEIICFDSYETDGDNTIITFELRKQRVVDWVDITDSFSSLDYAFRGFNKWYYMRDVPIEAGVEKVVRGKIKVPVTLEGTSGKYFFGIKPSSQTLQEAIQVGNFYYIDPWWDASWGSRYNLTYTCNNPDGDCTNEWVALDYSGTNCDTDLRIVYQGAEEIPFELNDTAEVVYFFVNGTNSTPNQDYALYCDNDAASDGSDEDLKIFYENCDDVSDWTKTQPDHTDIFSNSSSPLSHDSDYGDVCQMSVSSSSGSFQYIYTSLDEYSIDSGDLYLALLRAPNDVTTSDYKDAFKMHNDIGGNGGTYLGINNINYWFYNDGSAVQLFAAERKWNNVVYDIDLDANKWDLFINNITRDTLIDMRSTWNGSMSYLEWGSADINSPEEYLDEIVVSRYPVNVYRTKGDISIGEEETESPSDSCTPPAEDNDWEITSSDNCSLTEDDGDINIGTGKIVLDSSVGSFNIDGANVTCSGIVKPDGVRITINPANSKLVIST